MATARSDAYYRLLGTLANSRLVTRLHPVVYRLAGGRGLLGRNLALNVVLTTTGRRSGRPRDVPLLAFPDGDAIVVVASKNGSDREPAWLWNLRTQPEAHVRVGREVRVVRAREAIGDERARLWSAVVEAYGGYAVYQRRTTRPIPIVVLERAGEG